MPNKEVHVGDDWYLDENNNGDLIVVNSNTGKVVKAIDKETGDEDKKGNSINNVFIPSNNLIIPSRLTNELVGYWPAIQGSGTTLYDRSGNGNNGTIIGSVWTSMMNGRALSFDGADDNVNLTDLSILDFGTGNFSVSLWFKPSSSLVWSVDDEQILYSKNYGTANNTGWSISWEKWEGLSFRIGDGVSKLRVSEKTDTEAIWHHIIGTRDSSNLILYIDGSQVDSTTSSGLNTTNSSKAIIGAVYSGGLTSFFDGFISEVRAYHRALSATEISNLYNKTRKLYGV